KEPIPLRPCLDELAVRVDDDDAVAHDRLAARRRIADGALRPRWLRRQRRRNLELAAIRHEDAIRRFRKHAALRSPGVTGMTQRLVARRLRPVLRDVVRSRRGLAAFRMHHLSDDRRRSGYAGEREHDCEETPPDHRTSHGGYTADDDCRSRNWFAALPTLIYLVGFDAICWTVFTFVSPDASPAVE